MKRVITFLFHFFAFFSSTIKADYLISGSEDSRINVWNLNGTLEKTIEKFSALTPSGHNDAICIFSIFNQGFLLSGSRDSYIKIWFMGNFTLINNHPGGLVIKSIKFLSENRFAFATENAITVLTYPSFYLSPFIPIAVQKFQAIEYIAETETIIAGLDNGLIKLYNAITGVPHLFPLNDHTAAITDLKKINNGYFASSSRDNTITVWNILTNNKVTKITGHSSQINSLAALNDTILVSGSDDHTIRFWNFLTGAQVLSIDTTFVVYSLERLGDGNIASSLQNGKIKIWNSKNGSLIRELTHTTSYVSMFPLIYYPYDNKEIGATTITPTPLTTRSETTTITNIPDTTTKAFTTATTSALTTSSAIKSVSTDSTKITSISITNRLDGTSETISLMSSTESSISQPSQSFEPYSNRFRLVKSDEVASLVNQITSINSFSDTKSPFRCVKKCSKHAFCGLAALTESKECTLFRIEITQNSANQSFENTTLIYKRLN